MLSSGMDILGATLKQSSRNFLLVCWIASAKILLEINGPKKGNGNCKLKYHENFTAKVHNILLTYFVGNYAISDIFVQVGVDGNWWVITVLFHIVC